ncbi:MAG: RsiV family protein [Bacteroidales bacterium]|nr:RsiV family protein [Bacteroidales bacterium]
MRIFPTKTQWKKWSLPSKLSVIGVYITTLSFIIFLITIIPSSKKYDSSNNQTIISQLNYDVFNYIIDSLSIDFSYPYKGEWKDFYGLNNTYNVTYPVIKFKDNILVENKVKEQIREIFMFWELDIDNIEKSTWEGEIKSNFKVVYKIHNLLGIRIETFWYGMGAAHGNISITSLNLNMANGEIFEFKDIFRSWSSDSIKQLLIEKLLNHSCVCVDEKVEIDNYDDKNFYFDSTGINVVFSKYEVACGACGPVEVKLLYNEILDLINPNGPMKYIYN